MNFFNAGQLSCHVGTLERNVHRSQNRIESYHQLRAAIAQVGGKKELTGRTDTEIEISNQCARLIANAIIYYNSPSYRGYSRSTRRAATRKP